jgi:hypothetical protein
MASLACRGIGLLAAVSLTLCVSSLGWAEQREATVLRGPMTERPAILVQQIGGCKNPAAHQNCTQEQQASTGCRFDNACTPAINTRCYNANCQ